MEDIAKEIESLRMQLEELIGDDIKKLQEVQVIELSQKLDVLIVAAQVKLKDYKTNGSIEEKKVIRTSYFQS